MISEQVIEEIRNRTDIAEVIGEYVNLTRKGDKFWGLSPFKNEKTPSFTVTPAKQMYYCFATNKGGNVFTFIMEMEGMNFPEAVEYLAKRVGIEVGAAHSIDSTEMRERKVMEELYAKISESMHFLLTSKEIGQKALDYIAERGFSMETVEKFFLGYSHPDPFWLHRFLQSKGYSTEFLMKTGLFTSKNNGRCLFADRLMFPIQRHQGEVIAFGGRLLSGNGPKYINSADNLIYHKRQNLYGLSQAKEGIKARGFFVLCEGYLDVLAFHQSGVTNAVAPLGTAFTAEQAKILGRYARRGLVVFDGDSAGVAASRKAAVILEHEGIACDILSLDSGLDPADILKKNGSQAVENLVQSPSSALDFLLAKAVSEFDVHSPDGKNQILEQLFPYIQSINSPIKKEACIQIVADRIGLTPSIIAESMRMGQPDKRGRGNLEKQHGQGEHKQNAEKNFEPELTPGFSLLLATVIHPEHFKYVRSHVRSQDIEGEYAKMLYVLLEEHYSRGELNFSKILASVEHAGLRNYIMKKASKNEYGEGIRDFISGAVTRVRHDILLKRRREIEVLMKVKERKSEAQALRELLAEKMYLDSALMDLKDSIHDRTAE